MPNVFSIEAEVDIKALRGLASLTRIRILKVLFSEGALNVNELAKELGLPQSTVAVNVQTLENAGLIATSIRKAKKGHQKVCSVCFGEIVVRLPGTKTAGGSN